MWHALWACRCRGGWPWRRRQHSASTEGAVPLGHEPRAGDTTFSVCGGEIHVPGENACRRHGDRLRAGMRQALFAAEPVIEAEIDPCVRQRHPPATDGGQSGAEGWRGGCGRLKRSSMSVRPPGCSGQGEDQPPHATGYCAESCLDERHFNGVAVALETGCGRHNHNRRCH